MFKIINEAEFIKRKILKLLQKSGCDIDGDIFTYNGKKYFVHELRGIVEEVK